MRLNFRRLVMVCAMGAVAGLAAGAPRVEAEAVEARPRMQSAAARAERAPVQVADEITRRLRRLGINIIPTRLDNPYEPFGEVC